MSYEPTNWKTGDVITAEKLNKLEDGVASGGSGGGSSSEGPYKICFKCQCHSRPAGSGDYTTDYELVSAELSAQDFKTAVFNGKHPLLVVELRTEHVYDDTGEPTGQPDNIILYRCTDYATTSLGTYMMLFYNEFDNGPEKYLLSIPVNDEPTYVMELLYASCRFNVPRKSDGTYPENVSGSLRPRDILKETQRKFIDGEFDFSVVIDNRMGSSVNAFKRLRVEHAEWYYTSEDQGGMVLTVYFDSFSIIGRYDSDTWSISIRSQE